MAKVVRTVFAPLAEQSTAVAMSVVAPEPTPQCLFPGRAAAIGNPSVATKCVSSGEIEDTVAAAFVSAGYLVSNYAGRNISLAFAEFGLVQYNG